MSASKKNSKRALLLAQEKKYYINKVLCMADPKDPAHFLKYRFNRVFILFGFTGSGKDTLINGFLKQNKKFPFAKFIRTITRHRRPNELEMFDGFFVEKKLFDYLKTHHRFFYCYERYNGSEFGYDTLHFTFQLAQNNILMVGGHERNLPTLVQGIHDVIDTIPVTTIFVNRPKDKIVAHLKKRGGDPAEVRTRVRVLSKEWRKKPVQKFDHMIWNTDLDQSIRKLTSIIQSTLKSA